MKYEQYLKPLEGDYDLVKRFRLAFMSQDMALAKKCFDNDGFGKHMGMTLDQYIDYEMAEFKGKSKKFGISSNDRVNVWRISNDSIYFCFGNELDRCLFESIWSIGDGGLLTGNKSDFRWEPKMQMVKSGEEITKRRICNIKSPFGIDMQLASFIGRETPFSFSKKMNEDAIMGGSFLSIGFDELNDLKSYWGSAFVRYGGGRESARVWMRGTDHPFFKNNLWPSVNYESGEILAPKEAAIVILTVVMENGDVKKWKYPKEKKWLVDGKVKEVCLTDSISTDWIVRKS
jgi:hypothetical protein